jgi:hypothetical protein
VAQRIKWLGEIKRIEDVNLVKRITDRNYTGIRTKRWPKSIWGDEAINDVPKLKLRNWSQRVRDRKAWNDRVQTTTRH